jgi:uncharacterized protein (TIGR00730 family)
MMQPSSAIKSICVYCGSADNLPLVYLDAAAQIGKLLAKNGYRLVYGAGKTGMMGTLADSVLSNGGEVIGITPENLNPPQLIHANLTRLEVVPDIHIRKARMSALADAFIALPGGFGTLDELFETLTWAQIGLHAKPIGILNTNNYYDPLVEMVNKARSDHFIYSEHEQLFVIDCDPTALLDKLTNFCNPDGIDRWVHRD